MTESTITYRDLFELLVSLGFSRIEDEGNHVFHHDPTETVLGYRRGNDEFVTPADLLSAEVHLSGRGIIERPLNELFSSSSTK